MPKVSYALAAVLVAACSSDLSTDSTTNPVVVHTMTVQPGSHLFTATSVRAAYVTSSGSTLVVAYDSLHSPVSSVTLYVDAARSTGLYTFLNSPSMILTYTRGDSNWTTSIGRLGSISFTTVSTTRIVGSYDAQTNVDPALTSTDSTTSLRVKGTFDISIP